jgi:fibronectin-binding autotransporter adhesin
MNIRSLVRLIDSPGHSGIVLAAAVIALFSVTSAQAALTYSGDISPATDPATWTGGNSGTTAYIGYNSGNGSLALDGGSQVLAKTLYQGYAAGNTGIVTVDGTGSALNMSSYLYTGYSGTGIMNITNGGSVNAGTAGLYLGYNAGSTGTISIDGSGSTLTSGGYNYIGLNGSGTITVTNGGKFIGTGSYNYLGNSAGGAGTITVDGAGSSWSGNGTLYVGRNGAGTLNILNGSALSVTGNAFVGAAGAINFGTNGGTLTTGGILYSYSQLSGSGTINTSGVVTDRNLVFDATHGTAQSFASNGITVNLTQGAAGALGVGYSGSGTLTIADGVSIASKGGYLGYNSGATGTATVTGTGTSWDSGTFYVGMSGAGSLAIANGGVVSSAGAYLGYNAGSNGSATVEGSGSAWNVLYELGVGYSGKGSLNIVNGGTVSSSSIRLGSTTGATGTVTVSGSGSKLSVVNIPTNNPPLYLGYYGNGVMTISNGATLETSASVQMGIQSSSTSTVTIDGAGSSWNCNGASNGLTIGDAGKATLNITNGGTVTVNNYAVTVGSSFGSGTVNVAGPGSKLTIAAGNGITVGLTGTGRMNITNGGNITSSTGSKDFTVGNANINGGSGTIYINGAGSSLNNSGTINLGPPPGVVAAGIGRLIIRDGGTVTATRLNISSTSLLTADVSRGSSLTVGTGTITNNGVVRLVAGAGASAGTYSPISYGAMSGTGSVQTLGGNWDAANHTVTVSQAITGAAGSALTVDLATTQRFLFTDGSTGKTVGAAFQGTATPASMTLTASAMNGSELTSLQGLLDAGQTVLSGWNFTTTGYTSGDPVYLSLFAGSDQLLSDLTIWHFEGSTWGKYDAMDLAYDNTYASFTVNGLSSYAVTGAAPVPIPAAAWLLSSGLAGLGFLRRRFKA